MTRLSSHGRGLTAEGDTIVVREGSTTWIPESGQALLDFAFNLGVALEDLGRTSEALDAYERAIASDADCADAHYNLARLCERLGKQRSALRHFYTYRKLTQHG